MRSTKISANGAGLLSNRILLLSADFGSGHLQAGRAVARACESLHPGAVTRTANLDNRFLRMLSGGYLQLLARAPGAYRRLYHAPVGATMRTVIRTGIERAVRQEIERMLPTAVAATHPFPGAAAAHLRLRGRLRAPLAMILTDFAPHRVWVHPGVDQYFVASEDAAEELALMGAERSRITVSGIPVRQGFGARQRRPSGGAHILVMGGGLGLGPILEAVDSLAAQPDRAMRITVVCGSNEGLRATLALRHGGDPRVAILGYASDVAGLMRDADLLVSKPGALTASEALAAGLPMILLDPLPGHEEENAAWLTASGAATVADSVGVGRTALGICSSSRLPRMQACALAAGRPEAASLVAQFLLRGPGVKALQAAAAKQ